jgi:hypothetical protein
VGGYFLKRKIARKRLTLVRILAGFIVLSCYSRSEKW